MDAQLILFPETLDLNFCNKPRKETPKMLSAITLVLRHGKKEDEWDVTVMSDMTIKKMTFSSLGIFARDVQNLVAEALMAELQAQKRGPLVPCASEAKKEND